VLRKVLLVPDDQVSRWFACINGMAQQGGKMRGIVAVSLVVTMLAGCASVPQRDRNILAGAGIGAGVGALIGHASGGPPGAWAGAAIGAVSGGAIASLIPHDGCYIRNKQGEVWQVPCGDPRFQSEACFVEPAPNDSSQVACWPR
jgi:hypothetical protein